MFRVLYLIPIETAPMANIVLVDPDEIAQRALLGVLGRDNHRCVPLATAAEAWEFIRHNVKVDLVMIELKLKEESGVSLISRLKSDRLLAHLPVVVYTLPGDRESVRRALALRVQNVLLKPAEDSAIFSEINKATEAVWYSQHFEDPATSNADAGQALEALQQKRVELRKALELGKTFLIEVMDSQDINQIRDEHKIVTIRMDSESTEAALKELRELTVKAKEAGVKGVVACLEQLMQYARSANWVEFRHHLYNLDFCSRVIFHYLNPDLIPEGFLLLEEVAAANDASERERWGGGSAEKGGFPVVRWEDLKRELETLKGCPVIDSAAAAFHMAANGRPTSLMPLIDLVDKDPGLSAQILIALAKLRKSRGRDSGSDIEEPRVAIGMLGELRLSSVGYGLVPAKERSMLVPPVSSWPQYWMFQLGTGRIAYSVAKYMEFNALEEIAYTAGLMHDLGKLLLIGLHPLAFQRILSHAREHKMSMSRAEKLHLGVTTQEIAAYFADFHGLPRRLANVMRWVESPELATEHGQLVAVVALARHLCRQNGLGFSGQTPEEEIIALELTPAWRVLMGRVFPSFSLVKFEAFMRNECRHLKNDLLGRVTQYTMA